LKVCASCNEEKASEFFHKKKKSKDGLHNYCKYCTASKNKKWYECNKEQHAASCASWYSRNKEKANRLSTEWHYQNRYGISYDDFLKRMEDQQNLCAVCNTTLSLGSYKSASRAVLDHCHSSNNLRSVLCNACNSGLGHFRDKPELLEKAANYLRKHNQNIIS
jgi:hypothetical protein